MRPSPFLWLFRWSGSVDRVVPALCLGLGLAGVVACGSDERGSKRSPDAVSGGPGSGTAPAPAPAQGKRSTLALQSATPSPAPTPLPTAAASPAPTPAASPAASPTPVASPGPSAVPTPRESALTAGIFDDLAQPRYLADLWARVRLRSDFLQSLGKVVQPTKDAAPRSPSARLQLAFLVGTHSRLAPEVQALKSEMEKFLGLLDKSLPEARKEYALVSYRDKDEAYLVRDAGFGENAAAFRAQVETLTANGGGDEPEAVGAAMRAVRERLSWEADARKIVVWVTNAPPREKEWAPAQRTIAALAAEGIEIYPVAAADTSLTAEYFLRWTAARTSGRFLFLTDDGTPGAVTREPFVPCFLVKRLVPMLAEVVTRRMRGEAGVDPFEGLVRRSGRFEANGTCKVLR